MPRKPSGTIVSTSFVIEGRSLVRQHDRVLMFPTDKVAIERMMIAIYRKWLVIDSPEVSCVEQSSVEQGFDAEVRFNDGLTADLDLTEYVRGDGSSTLYRDRTGEVPTVLELSDSLMACVNKKSEHYGPRSSRSRPLWLLVYTTHQDFIVSPEAIYRACARFGSQPGFGFDRVDFLWPSSCDRGTILPVFPASRANPEGKNWDLQRGLHILRP